MASIHDIKPRETAGRDTTNRFRMQFQAAAFAALEILSGKEVDRVFCDYHDDFVVRRSIGGITEYHFFQVKTKGKINQQWRAEEILPVKKRTDLNNDEDVKAVRNSIAGKLFLHTIEFGQQCREVTVLSNVHFDDNALQVAEHLKNGTSTHYHLTQFIEKFSEIFSPTAPLSDEEAKAAMAKFSLLQAPYIADTIESFTNAAREAIWNYSEIDLERHEVDNIAKSLIELVHSKSCAPINSLDRTGIDLVTSIGLDDLLRVLSISTEVYKTLQSGNDPSAIKTASILQRRLKSAGASDSLIEIASAHKVAWDVWLRTARHSQSSVFNLQLLLDEIDKKCKDWVLAGGIVADLQSKVNEMLQSSTVKPFTTLTPDLLTGGFFAAIARRVTV